MCCPANVHFCYIASPCEVTNSTAQDKYLHNINTRSWLTRTCKSASGEINDTGGNGVDAGSLLEAWRPLRAASNDRGGNLGHAMLNVFMPGFSSG
jgi:hypothetical protein